MKNSIKNNIISFLCVPFLLVACISTDNDIYKKIPKGSSLDIEKIKASEAIFKTNFGFVLIYNLVEKGDDEYNPHLLFFDRKNRLISASYFLSEDVYDYQNNVITAYLNEHRLQRHTAFRNEVPEGIIINYKDYTFSYPSSKNVYKGVLDSLSYNKKNNTVDFFFKRFNLSKK